MNTTPLLSAVIVAMTMACNNNPDTERDARGNNVPDVPGAATSENANARDSQAQQVTLTGCLQDSNDGLILTRVNEPTGSVGTSGQTSSAPQEQQLRSARQAYRVEAKDGVDLKSAVGKQVSLAGTITEQSDLSAKANEQPNTNKDRDALDIDPSDLAKFEASQIVNTAENCR
jgi:hypothetical protein